MEWTIKSWEATLLAQIKQKVDTFCFCEQHSQSMSFNCNSLSSFVLFTILTIHIISIQSTSSTNNGNFMVIINPQLSFILCSPTQQEFDKSELRLININDVVNNPTCIQSAQFDLNTHQLLLERSPHKLIKLDQQQSLGIDHAFYLYLAAISWQILK